MRGRKAGSGKLHPDQIAFRSIDLLPHLEVRTDRCETSEHTVARRDLLRYYRLLDDSMPQVSEDELAFMCEVVSNDDYQHVCDEVAGAPADVEDRYGVNADELVVRLREMNPWQVMALLDAVERYRLLREAGA